MDHGAIKQILSITGVTPSKKMGQNFLNDEKVCKDLVDQLLPQPDDIVVECGPGTGSLTRHLLGRVKKVILVEFDGRLAEYLSNQFADRDDVEVHHADGAKFDTRELFKYGPIKFLGNLPYSSGGVIIRNFLKRPSMVKRAALMLQKEFVDRILAKPRTKDYGVLTLRMQSEWVCKEAFIVSPEALTPRPLIDSTVMVVEPKKPRDMQIYDARLFDELIRRGFAQRRKQIKNQLPDYLDWAEVAAQVGLKVTARAEEISLDDWIKITNIYDQNPLKDVAQKDDELFDVVDDNDEVIGQEERKIVHDKKLKHRAVHVLVFNKRKELLLQKRSLLKDKFPGAWGTSAAGHLEAGESYDDCVVRELKEELGIEGVDTQQIARISPCENTGWEFIDVHLARHDGALRFPCSEVFAAEWFSIEQVRDWVAARPQDFSSGFLECWNLFYEKLGAAMAAAPSED